MISDYEISSSYFLFRKFYWTKECSSSYFYSASFIGPKNEMYCDVLSDQMIFYPENPKDLTNFRNSVISTH